MHIESLIEPFGQVRDRGELDAEFVRDRRLRLSKRELNADFRLPRRGAAFPQNECRMGNGVLVEVDRHRYETGFRILGGVFRKCARRHEPLASSVRTPKAVETCMRGGALEVPFAAPAICRKSFRTGAGGPSRLGRGQASDSDTPACFRMFVPSRRCHPWLSCRHRSSQGLTARAHRGAPNIQPSTCVPGFIRPNPAGERASRTD